VGHNSKLSIAVIGLAMALSAFVAQTGSGAELLLIQPWDRVLVLAPHPDDEVLGCGGTIQKALAQHVPVKVVFLTSGDANEWSFALYRGHPVIEPSAALAMGRVRVSEAVAADRLLGLSTNALVFLGYPDFGMLRIWAEHWADAPALKSVLTRVTAVPYENAYHPEAPYKGEEVLGDLKRLLLEFRPTKIFVSHPADRNPDHRALYLFTKVALWDLQGELAPQVYPYLVHFADWPQPSGLVPAERLRPPVEFSNSVWYSTTLAPAQVDLKLVALRRHRTQFEYSGWVLERFVRRNELFGDFPDVQLFAQSREQPIAQDTPAEARQVPREELTDEERAAFVGIERRTAFLEGGRLVVTIRFSRPLAEEVGCAISLFGYRPDRPFAQMPKLVIRLDEGRSRVLERGRALAFDEVEIQRQTRGVRVAVPLSTLGNPTRVLTSARTYLADVPLDLASWRALAVEPAP